VTSEARVTVTIDASPKTVFEHLVEKDKMLRWMGVSADLEGKPGTPLTIEMNSDSTAGGEFLEVVPYERVVFTWGWLGNAEIPPGSSTVEISLKPVGDNTELTLVHTGLPSERDFVEHTTGWTHFLDRLTELMTSRPGRVGGQ